MILTEATSCRVLPITMISMGDHISISELSQDQHVISVLHDYASVDGQIDLQILDNNADHFLDYKRSFLTDLSQEQFLALQNNLQRFGFTPRDAENVVEAYGAFSELQQNGKNASEIFSYLEAHASWFVESFAWQVPTLLTCFDSEQNLVRFLDLLKTSKPFSGMRYERIRFAMSFLLQPGAKLGEIDWSAYVKTVATLVPYTSGERQKRAARAIAKLDLDWHSCLTLNGFGTALARAMNARAQARSPDDEWAETVTNISAMICNIYDHREDDGDKKKGVTDFLSGFGPALSDQTLYQLVSLNYGGHLMTTIFDILWRPQGVTSPGLWIKRMDPDNHLRGKFLQNLSSLDRVKIFSDDISYVFNALLEELQSPATDVWKYSSIVTHYVDELLPLASAQEKKMLAELLWTTSQQAPADSLVQKTAAFLIKYYGPRYQLDLYKPQLKTFWQSLPPITIPQIPADQWLKDKSLKTRLCFYSEQEYTTNEEDKDDEQRWFEYTQELLTQKYGWTLSKTDLISPLKTADLEKQVNGVTLRVTLTLQILHSTKDPLVPLTDENTYDMRFHRGHHDTLPITAPTDGNQTNWEDGVKLVYMGACKSMSTATEPDVQREYANDLIISDRDVSKGELSTEFMDVFMTNVAKGKYGWEEYKKFSLVNKFIFPNSPLMLVLRYLREN